MQMVGQSNLHESLQETAQSQPEAHHEPSSSRFRPSHNEAEIIGDETLHHLIAEDQSQPLLYGDWLRANSCDAALEVGGHLLA